MQIKQLLSRLFESAGNKTILFLLVLTFMSLLPNLGLYEFKNEESLRAIIAYEMHSSGNYVQPSYLGEDYFKKPPMYTWLTVLSAQFTGWQELAVRIPSISAFLLSCFFVFLFTRNLFKDNKSGLLASLVYATSIEILFFYGFIGEIDGTFTFAVFIILASQVLAFEQQRYAWLLVSGIFTSIAFMLKGFPAFVFFGLTLLTLIFLYKRYSLFKKPSLYIASTLCLLLPAAWMLSSPDPQAYISTLFTESASRTQESMDFAALAKHMVLFPFDIFVKLLPGSLFLLLPLLLIAFKRKSQFLSEAPGRISPIVKILIIITLVNFIPYWISVGARVRYVLPLLPFIAIITAYIMLHYSSPLWLKRFLQAAAIIIVIRFIFGAAIIPLVISQQDLESSDKQVAFDMMNKVALNEKSVACNCTAKKAICLYIDLEQNRVLKKSRLTPDWDYLISCDTEADGNVIAEYPKRKTTVYLYERSAAPIAQ